MSQMDWSFEPWIVGDTSTLGLAEQILEEKIEDICSYIKIHYGQKIPCSLIDEMLELYEIDYIMLPQYLKDKLDYFDVY